MVLTLGTVQYTVDFYPLFMTTATPGMWEPSLRCICIASSTEATGQLAHLGKCCLFLITALFCM